MIKGFGLSYEDACFMDLVFIKFIDKFCIFISKNIIINLNACNYIWIIKIFYIICKSPLF
jgi:hypothetical protein